MGVSSKTIIGPSISSPVDLRGDSLASLSFHVSVRVWEDVASSKGFPESLLHHDGLTIAGGTVKGQLFIRRCPIGENLHFGQQEHATNGREREREVPSVCLLDSRRMLAVSRCGVLIAAALTPDEDTPYERIDVCWRVQCLRMYVSSLGVRKPLLVVSDGFDNAIRTLLCG